MKGKFNAAKRMRIMSAVMALADDRGGLTLDEAAEILALGPDRIRECLHPLTDLEYTNGSELLGDLGNAVTISEDGAISVNDNWWRDIGGLSPGEAARLITQLDHARAILGEREVAALGSLRKRLSALVGVTVHEPVPEKVRLLFTAMRRFRLVRAAVLSGEASLTPEPRLWETYAVFQAGSSWRATLVEHGSGDAFPRVVYVDHIESLTMTFADFTPRAELPDQEPGPTRAPIAVVIEHPKAISWKLKYFEASSEEIPAGRLRTTLHAPTERSLRQLILRLGPGTEVIDPPEYVDLPRRTAQEILARYES